MTDETRRDRQRHGRRPRHGRAFRQAARAAEVTVFGAEPRVNYNRIMLSPVLSGEKNFEDIIIHDHAWYANTASSSAGRGRAIDRAAKTVRERRGECL